MIDNKLWERESRRHPNISVLQDHGIFGDRAMRTEFHMICLQDVQPMFLDENGIMSMFQNLFRSIQPSYQSSTRDIQNIRSNGITRPLMISLE